MHVLYERCFVSHCTSAWNEMQTRLIQECVRRKKGSIIFFCVCDYYDMCMCVQLGGCKSENR
jgi:hypothetical protein